MGGEKQGADSNSIKSVKQRVKDIVLIHRLDSLKGNKLIIVDSMAQNFNNATGIINQKSHVIESIKNKQLSHIDSLQTKINNTGNKLLQKDNSIVDSLNHNIQGYKTSLTDKVSIIKVNKENASSLSNKATGKLDSLRNLNSLPLDDVEKIKSNLNNT